MVNQCAKERFFFFRCLQSKENSPILAAQIYQDRIKQVFFSVEYRYIFLKQHNSSHSLIVSSCCYDSAVYSVHVNLYEQVQYFIHCDVIFHYL